MNGGGEINRLSANYNFYNNYLKAKRIHCTGLLTLQHLQHCFTAGTTSYFVTVYKSQLNSLLISIRKCKGKEHDELE